MPSTYSSIAEESKGLAEARKAYSDFLEATFEDEERDKVSDVLPTLRFLMEKGNVTTYEWVHGEAPISVEETKMDFGQDDEEEQEGKLEEDGGGIDFGDDDVGGGIDFGDDAGGDAGDIDWGNLDSGDAQVSALSWITI